MNKRTSKNASTQRSHKASPTGTGTRRTAGGAGSRRESPKHTAGRPNISQYAVKEPMELLPFLLLKNAKLGRNAVKALLARGQAAVNDRVVTEYNHPLVPGQTVTVRRDKAVEEPPLVGLTILHEDEDIIVIQKNAGLLSIASSQEDEVTAYRQLMAHVRVHNPASRIHVVHRLDRDTSGVMMFAKSERIQQLLQNSWHDTVKERTYVALVEGCVKKPEGTITSWLKESSTLKMYSSRYPNDGQHAVTHYRTIQSNNSFSLLEVQLETGRKNQIRVHMQDIGHPIVGDKKYGSRSKAINRMGLHARVLAFVHPATGSLLRFETDIPKSFLAPFRQT
jgi:23S rRNA pseudouridine1911/1915/1917 synthase